MVKNEFTVAELCEAIERGNLAAVRDGDEHYSVSRKDLNRYITEKKLHPLSKVLRTLS